MIAFKRAGTLFLLLISGPLAAGPAPAESPSHYPTPDAAVQALIDAAASNEPGALVRVLGPDVKDLQSGDPVADAADREAFVDAAAESARIEQGKDADHATLTVGDDHWPFPIPLVRDANGWYFDVAAGREELYNRRIGRNELTTIAVLRAFVDAEDEYTEQDRNGDGIREYARKLMSSEGAHDGLYWPTKAGEPDSPMGPLVAEAVAAGYHPGESSEPKPYHGYYYRILTAQGKHAPGGAKSYLNGEHMIKGFAAVAYPAQYGNSGVMTFMVNQSGIVFQKNLGADTAKAAAAIDRYDPDDSWQPVTD
jgi:hypothetical protein